MSTGYNFQLRSFFYDCQYGCFDLGFASEILAAEAEAGHDCMHARFPGGAEDS